MRACSFAKVTDKMSPSCRMVLENVLEAVAKQQQVLEMTRACRTRTLPNDHGSLQKSPDYTKPPIRNCAGPLLQLRIAFARLQDLGDI